VSEGAFQGLFLNYLDKFFPFLLHYLLILNLLDDAAQLLLELLSLELLHRLVDFLRVVDEDVVLEFTHYFAEVWVFFELQQHRFEVVAPDEVAAVQVCMSTWCKADLVLIERGL